MRVEWTLRRRVDVILYWKSITERVVSCQVYKGFGHGSVSGCSGDEALSESRVHKGKRIIDAERREFRLILFDHCFK
jgi:hypothetical protein